jgi:hypothetical protein
MADYDIRKAFEKIENELISSMIRNMANHRAWEDEEGFQWEQWQALQLKELEAYKRRNQKLFGKKFREINEQLELAILKAREDGNMEQELELLEMVKTGKIKKPRVTKKSAQTNAEFFKMNDRKMKALINATVSDMEKAETAILRMANDKYRKIIFDAQVYANSGAGTYEQAVDMATKDFLAAGLNCVEYKNGARHTLKDYAEMALRTATKRAYLAGEGEKRKEWGIPTVIVNKRGNPCSLCLPFVGKVMIDDVWSGGSSKDGKYPLLSSAISAGLYHPRCKDSHSTYFEGISTPPDSKFTKKDIKQIEEVNKAETKKQYAQRQAEKYGRLGKYSLDKDNKKTYASKEMQLRDIEKSYDESIIKSLDLDDYEIRVDGTELTEEVSMAIFKTIKERERRGELYISDVQVKPLPNGKHGIPAMQIEPNEHGLLQLNINSNLLGGLTLEQANKVFEDAIGTVANSLEDAVVHECGHAKLVKGMTVSEIKALYDELDEIHFEGISSVANIDGAELIAEIEVLLNRGDSVPENALKLYKKYMERKAKEIKP